MGQLRTVNVRPLTVLAFASDRLRLFFHLESVCVFVPAWLCWEYRKRSLVLSKRFSIKTMLGVSELCQQIVYNTLRSFHRLTLPFSDTDRLKLWLVVLQQEMDPNTPVNTLRLVDHWVCSDHFDRG